MPGSEKPEYSQLLLPTPSFSLPSHHRPNPFFYHISPSNYRVFGEYGDVSQAVLCVVPE